MDDEILIRERDSNEYPNCHHSVSMQESCSQLNNSYVCETLRRITRNCPNESPVEIFRKREHTNDDNNNIFGNSVKDSPHLEKFDRILDQFMGHNRTADDRIHSLDPFMNILGIFEEFGKFANPDKQHRTLDENTYQRSAPFPPPHKIYKDKMMDTVESTPHPSSGRVKGKIEKGGNRFEAYDKLDTLTINETLCVVSGENYFAKQLKPKLGPKPPVDEFGNDMCQLKIWLTNWSPMQPKQLGRILLKNATNTATLLKTTALPICQIRVKYQA
eukprot:gene996-1954_t